MRELTGAPLRKMDTHPPLLALHYIWPMAQDCCYKLNRHMYDCHSYILIPLSTKGMGGFLFVPLLEILMTVLRLFFQPLPSMQLLRPFEPCES